MSSYEVQAYTICNGWINAWTEDGIPHTFATAAEARAELDEFLAEIQEQIDRGDRQPDDGYSEDEYRVVNTALAEATLKFYEILKACLNCTDMSLDDLDETTEAAIKQGEEAIAEFERKQSTYPMLQSSS